MSVTIIHMVLNLMYIKDPLYLLTLRYLPLQVHPGECRRCFHLGSNLVIDAYIRRFSVVFKIDRRGYTSERDRSNAERSTDSASPGGFFSTVQHTCMRWKSLMISDRDADGSEDFFFSS